MAPSGCAPALFGSDRDEVLIRSTGQPGYYASDVAYHYNKFVLRGFDRVIDVWAVDHQNQARRMPYLMKALGLDPDRLTIVLYDLVRLYRDGQEVKLSKRSGDIITVDEVAEEVGADAVRFLLLDPLQPGGDGLRPEPGRAAKRRKPGLLRAVCARPDGQHPAHRGRARLSGRALGRRRPGLLRHPAELTLLRKMAELPEVIEKAATQLAPHHLAFYAQDLAGTFHAFYRDCRVHLLRAGGRRAELRPAAAGGGHQGRLRPRARPAGRDRAGEYVDRIWGF